jgi:hypothetical protein
MDNFQRELDSVDEFLNKNRKKPSMNELEPPPVPPPPPPPVGKILKRKRQAKNHRKDDGDDDGVEEDDEEIDLTTSELVRCGTCSKICTNLTTFGNHFRKEHCRTAADDEKTGSKPLLECGRCDFTTTNTTSLSRHKKLHLLPAKDLGFVCPDCPQDLDKKSIFTSKYRLNMHRIKRHRMPFKYNCKRCGKGYMDFGKLKSHASSCTELDVNAIPTIDLSKYFKRLL